MNIDDVDLAVWRLTQKPNIGGFLSALAECWIRADVFNKLVLKQAMTVIISKYPQSFS